jgi:hypothetical protein
MNMNVFCINLHKNIGKKLFVNDIVKKLSGQFWDGIDKSVYDDTGILLQTFGHDISTRAAKEAKINLFKHFLVHSKYEYLILLEDDICIHKNFDMYFKQVIQFANTQKFKLIYMGVSCKVNLPEKKENNIFTIERLPHVNYSYSGAYGVIVHKSIMKSIISRANDLYLYNKPFDIYSLGHVQKCYPNECFICNPQIIIPDITTSDIRECNDQEIFWSCCHIDKKNYIIPKRVPMYILTDDVKIKHDDMNILIKMFTPYVIPIYVQIRTKLGSLPITDINIFSRSIENIECIITNIYTNWTKNVGIIFEEAINSNMTTVFDIDMCQICSNQLSTVTMNSQILNGFTIVKPGKSTRIIKTKEIFNISKCINHPAVIYQI